MSVEGIFKGITRAKKEGNSIEGTGGQKRGQTRNCNLPVIIPTIINFVGTIMNDPDPFIIS